MPNWACSWPNRRRAGVELAGAVAAALRRRSRHYVAFRHPDAHPAGAHGSPYGPEDAEDAVADADRVITEARSAWRQLAEAADQTRDPDAEWSP